MQDAKLRCTRQANAAAKQNHWTRNGACIGDLIK